MQYWDTPVELVDFIIHSVNELLQSEFDQTPTEKKINHLLDDIINEAIDIFK